MSVDTTLAVAMLLLSLFGGVLGGVLGLGAVVVIISEVIKNKGDKKQ